MEPGRAGTAEPEAQRSDVVATLAWLAVAALLRFAALGRFSLWGDEVYSLDNALELFTPSMQPADLAFPLFYLLERGVLELRHLAGAGPPDPAQLQLLLRLVPAVAGSMAAAAAFRCSRGFLARGERHVLAALVAFSPWFLFFSQTARFYAPLLALCVPATFELLRAQRDGNLRSAIEGTCWTALAIATQPTAILLLAGHLVAVFTAALLRVRPLTRAVVPPLLLPLLIAVPAAFWPEVVRDTLLYKLKAQDAGVEGLAGLVLGIGWNVGPVIAALAALGLPTLWRRDKTVALHVIVGAGVPTLLLMVLAALQKSVEQRYLLAVVVLALLPAAAYVGELAQRLDGVVRGARLAVPLLAVGAWVPGLLSESIDGNRHDLAGALRFVTEHLQPGDGVVCDYHALARRYLPAELPDELLLEAPPPVGGSDGKRWKPMVASCPRLWIVLPAEFAEASAEHRAFQRWAWGEGSLQREFWRPRLDYHQNKIRVFLVEPKRAAAWWPGKSR
jgi:uncharacterized membrane protein YiaA